MAKAAGQLKLSRIILLVLLVLVTVPLVTHYYLSKVANDTATSSFHNSRSQLDMLDEFNSLKTSDLKMRIEEMLRIKASVSTELRELEARRRRLQLSISNYSQSLDDLKAEVLRQQMELERLKLSVEQARVAQKEALQRNTPELAAPRRILPSLTDMEDLPTPLLPHISACRLHLCFDFSRCSLTSGFPVYVYAPDTHSVGGTLDSLTKTMLMQTLGYNPHVTSDPSVACIYLVLVGEGSSENGLEQELLSLPYWRGDGRNHVLFSVSHTGIRTSYAASSNTGRAMKAHLRFSRGQFRPGFDLVLPPFLGPPGGDVWGESPAIVPARRKYLLSFQGEYQLPNMGARGMSDGGLDKSMAEAVGIDMTLVEMLKKIQFGSTEDHFFFQFSCSGGKVAGMDFEWALCDTDATRAGLLRDSTYTLILTPSNHSLISTHLLQIRLHEALKYGAIPVVLGSQMALPFEEFLDWNRAAIFLPKARITELHFLLRAIPDADLLSLRRQGRFLWERYMASVQAIVDTTIAVLRDRVGVPALPAEDEPSPSIFNATFVPLKMDSLVPEAELDESLGPMEPPYPSPNYQRNYTVARVQSYELWNEWGDPFHLHPYLPFDPVLPSEAKFLGSGIGFRPIGRGSGGAGKEFSEALGGNSAREQFTIVMLTYEREQVLMNSLARLFGLPYLNKVVVVWNSPRPPPEDLRWPDIGVPIHVVKAARNSLNNRFLPYSAIETEAVLSVDDDAHLRHDEIMFGFRVWREHRDRLVGFPGRYHAWDLKYSGWLYNSNYSCELSMVLTGAAFFHKYYAYLYSYSMPQAIRDKVDEYMNCEDIAMNFLVSHVTRKPPVKVTSRWTFRCPGCPVSLSEEDSHFQERHKCINFFSKVYGYTPLLNTQYRADSILFKTRIPHDKQKCFKFI